MQNRIDAAVSTADKTEILQLIQDIKAKMPFLVDLSAAEIASLNKMGDRGQPFVRDAITAAENDDSFLPRSFDVAAMRRDVDLLEMLPPIIAAVAQLKELLSDTYILAGSDAFAAALEVYAAAQRNGTGEALSESLRNMGRRFDRKPNRQKKRPPNRQNRPKHNILILWRVGLILSGIKPTLQSIKPTLSGITPILSGITPIPLSIKPTL